MGEVNVVAVMGRRLDVRLGGALLGIVFLVTTACSADRAKGNAGGGGAPACDAGGDGDCAPSDCAPGQRRLGDGSCELAGVPEDGCGPGFRHRDRGCEPVLPEAPCGDGLFALPGSTTCSSVAPCGAGTYGDVATDDETIHVDASYSAGASDGTAERPFARLGDAVRVAPEGALVVVAAGTYAESVVLGAAIRLTGRCPELVVLGGSPSASAAPAVRVTAPGVEIRGVAIEGTADGVLVTGSGSLLLESVHLRNTGERALHLQGTSRATLRDSLVEEAYDIAVFGDGADVEVERSVIRETLPGQAGGVALLAFPPLSGGDQPAIAVRGSVLERNDFMGIFAAGSSVVVEDSVVRDNEPGPAVTGGGAGIFSASDEARPDLAPSLEVRGSVIERNRSFGIAAFSTSAIIERTTVRDVVAQPDEMAQDGVAVGVAADPVAPAPPEVRITASLFERSRLAGLMLNGAAATVEGLLVRDVEAQFGELDLGWGIVVDADEDGVHRGDAAITGSVVERARAAGIGVVGSNADITATVVQSARAQELDGKLGDGVLVAMRHAESGEPIPASCTATRLVVLDSARAGLSVFGGSVVLADSVLSCNAFDMSADRQFFTTFRPGAPLGDGEVSLVDQGGNRCGCGDESRTCRAESSQLAPARPPPPLGAM